MKPVGVRCGGLAGVSGAVALGAAVASCALAVPAASAGFTLTIPPKFVNTPRERIRPFVVDDIFVTDGFGGFGDFVPDTANDPAIQPLDLVNYKYTLEGIVIAASVDTVVYAGSYSIFIDVGPPGPDFGVSDGSFLITATFDSSMHAALDGVLTQLSGPTELGIPDLSYGGSPIAYSGTYRETVPGMGGVIDGSFRQDAVPTPGVLSVLGLSGLVLARRRRR